MQHASSSYSYSLVCTVSFQITRSGNVEPSKNFRGYPGPWKYFYTKIFKTRKFYNTKISRSTVEWDITPYRYMYFPGGENFRSTPNGVMMAHTEACNWGIQYYLCSKDTLYLLDVTWNHYTWWGLPGLPPAYLHTKSVKMESLVIRLKPTDKLLQPNPA